MILGSFNHLIYQKGRDYAYETNANSTVQGRKKQRNTDGIEVMRHLTGIDVKFVRRLAIAPSNLAYSSERTIAIIRSSSVSLLWLLIEVELDEAPSLGIWKHVCHLQPRGYQDRKYIKKWWRLKCVEKDHEELKKLKYLISNKRENQICN